MASNPTKKQHYVPQVYLKGFSEDDVYTYSYSFETSHCLRQKKVPIESVCRENYLYEIKDNNGQFVAVNYLERCLCHLESMFSNYRNRLFNKAKIKENYKTKCFFTTEEKNFWKLYITIQMMRTPTVLSVAKEFSAEFFRNVITSKEAESIAVQQCLPFFKELNPDDKNCLTAFLEPIQSMSIALGIDTSGRIITSDNPVYCYSIDKTIQNLGEIVFPISSELVLFLFGGQLQKEYEKNRLFPLEDKDIESIIKPIAYSANQRVFSKKPLDRQIKEFILFARKDKELDNGAG